MKKPFAIALVMLLLVFLCHAVPSRAADVPEGEQEFIKNCAVCHPEGRNIINAAKTLHKKSLLANGIQGAADIVAKMRNPGPGMTQFDEKAIPDQTAKAIAEYILKTFP
jgi:cytochrome c6